MCKSNITLRKFLKLILHVYFYKILISCIFAITGYHDYSIKEFLRLLWPIEGLNCNFIDCFLMFYLCIPFLNILVRNMSQYQHLSLMTLLIFGFSIIALPFVVTFNSPMGTIGCTCYISHLFID